MFRQCIAFLLLLVFVASSFSKAVIIVDFYANQEYIAKTLCINRDRPLLGCCGRCQLRKKLHQDADRSANDPERRLENKLSILYLESGAGILTSIFCETFTLSYADYVDRHLSDRAIAVFRPPDISPLLRHG